MASTICVLLVSVLMVSFSNALYTNANQSPGNFGFNSAQVVAANGPIRPLPNFPPLSWISNLPMPNFPQFPGFPQLSTIKPPVFPSIANQGGLPGGFQGVSVISHQQSNKKPDGTYDTTGGSTILLNDNGKVTVQQTGNAPPQVTVTQFKNPPFADFQQPEFNPLNLDDDIKKPHFDFPKFESFKPFDEDVLKTYVPESNEKFQGSSYSFNVYSSNVNGLKKSGGVASILTNDNGNVKEQKYVI